MFASLFKTLKPLVNRAATSMVLLAAGFILLGNSPVLAEEHHDAAGDKKAHVSDAGAAHGKKQFTGEVHLERNFKTQFGYSYLTAYMFFLSLCLGCLFLNILHHLFDAGWSVPIRRIYEHGANLLPIMGILWIPIGILARDMYPWMKIDPSTDHALHVKQSLFNPTSFYVCSISLFVIWTILARGLRKWSLQQDTTGSAHCTTMMRRYSAVGIFIFAFSTTLAAILWMKSLQHQFFSTMYGVYYFAGSTWLTFATTYFIVSIFRKGPLKQVIFKRQVHDLGVLFFAFTVFYSYIHFSQYFLIWNAAIPEETFWYVLREKGSWFEVGMLIIFGHFFLPFLSMLRIDVKLKPMFMFPLVAWAWFMHYTDMAFNVMPVLYPEGVHVTIYDPICFALIGIVLYKLFLKSFAAHPPYPLKDPRLKEAVEHQEAIEECCTAPAAHGAHGAAH